MKRIIHILLFLAVSTLAIAQRLNVESFTPVPNDITPRDSRYLRNDLNGNPCALVKVQLVLPDVKFSGYTIGSIDYKVNQYWVYMPAGSKKIQVNAPNYLPLDVVFADYSVERLEQKMAYVLTISVPTSNAAMQTLSVKYTPKNAMVLIDGQLLKGSNGLAEKELSIGSHSYNVFLEGYVGQMGTVSLTENAPGKLIIELDKESAVVSSNVKLVQPAEKQESITQVKEEKSDDGMEELEKNSIEAQLALAKERLQRDSIESQLRQHESKEQQQNFSSSSVIEEQIETFSNKPKTFTVNGVSFNMIPVEGGTFTMGATSEQGSDAYNDEKPAHSVTLSSYMIGETEVTQALWEAVMGNNPSHFKGNARPVEEVSWKDCQKFIEKLNKLTGKSFRLPTEAEWEYAARGGSKSQGYKYSGSNTLGDVAWYGDNASTTHDVKTKSSNELGIYDMSGNVYEWCHDWYGSYSSRSQTNPTGKSHSKDRVIRGGCWINNARFCRSASRNDNAPGSRYNNLGLRLAL